MNCHQCGKTANQPCKRSDCGYESSSATQDRLDRLAAKQEYDLNRARHNFRENFDRVAEWSESHGWTRVSDRPTTYRFASETDRGKLVIQAIARSL